MEDGRLVITVDDPTVHLEPTAPMKAHIKAQTVVALKASGSEKVSLGAVSADIPAIQLITGPMLVGHHKG